MRPGLESGGPNLGIQDMRMGNGQDTKHVHGPLGRPPWPSIVGISEGSRMESAFGPEENKGRSDYVMVK